MVKRVYVKTSNGKWKVQVGKKVTSTHRKKSRAVEKGVKAAKKNKPCSLYIQGEDGKMQDKRVYGKTSDLNWRA